MEGWLNKHAFVGMTQRCLFMLPNEKGESLLSDTGLYKMHSLCLKHMDKMCKYILLQSKLLSFHILAFPFSFPNEWAAIIEEHAGDKCIHIRPPRSCQQPNKAKPQSGWLKRNMQMNQVRKSHQPTNTTNTGHKEQDGHLLTLRHPEQKWGRNSLNTQGEEAGPIRHRWDSEG